MRVTIGVFGLAGSGKSTLALSFPNPHQHVIGSSEETTAENFRREYPDLPLAHKWDAALTLTPQEQLVQRTVPMVVKRLVNGKMTEVELPFLEAELERLKLTQMSHARNVANLWNYFRNLKATLTEECAARKVLYLEDRTEVLDNLTPFTRELVDYVQLVRKASVFKKDGDLNPIAYGIEYRDDLTDFLDLFLSLPCHTVFTCHVGMAFSQEQAAMTKFLDENAPILKKEWHPSIRGQFKYDITAKPDYAIFLRTETQPGRPTRFLAKLEADESHLGIGKPRIQPFEKPWELTFPKNRFYETFQAALTSYLTDGVPVRLP